MAPLRHVLPLPEIIKQLSECHCGRYQTSQWGRAAQDGSPFFSFHSLIFCFFYQEDKEWQQVQLQLPEREAGK
ncbi:hypothetical protein Y1Q_0019409 [Alligator mississippiensis]|uniref:Uncharacterized protein n=1 Tax=Alligator mississippiensis TaxID=8496 RepID=A0A151NCB7_ALLMI|nr:hypothetical protein Y1Q_0019409 [Alligator mississippiensis]